MSWLKFCIKHFVNIWQVPNLTPNSFSVTLCMFCQWRQSSNDDKDEFGEYLFLKQQHEIATANTRWRKVPGCWLTVPVWNYTASNTANKLIWIKNVYIRLLIEIFLGKLKRISRRITGIIKCFTNPQTNNNWRYSIPRYYSIDVNWNEPCEFTIKKIFFL